MDVQRFLPFRRLASTILAVPPLLLISCASPGPPRAPSLQLPQQVTDLSAERRGDDVVLRWSIPGTTADGLPLTGTLTAEICRAAVTGTPPPSCAAVLRLPFRPGTAEATDHLPPALTTNSAALLVYQVELRNRHERSAGVSNQAFAASGPAPTPVAALHTEPAERGALVRWSPADAADAVELGRRTVPSSAGQPPREKPSRTEPQELRLHVAPSATTPFARDAGGTLDTTARPGETYVYTAERIRTVTTQGHTLTLHSAASPAVTLVMLDSFPPQPPADLQAIATSLPTGNAIDLSWQPNTEPDLAGYLVFRVDTAATPPAVPVQLTPRPISQSTFRDSAALPGHTYAYTVRAVDTTGNRSNTSLPATEVFP